MIGQSWAERSFEFNFDFKRIFTVWLGPRQPSYKNIFLYNMKLSVSYFHSSWSTRRITNIQNTEYQIQKIKFLKHMEIWIIWHPHNCWSCCFEQIEWVCAKIPKEKGTKKIQIHANLTDLTCNGVGWWLQLIGC